MKRGAALPVVLLAITMASALAVGGAFVSRQYAGAARLSHHGSDLLPAADAAVVEAIAAWDSAARKTQPVGTVVAFPAGPSSSPRPAVWITRTSPQLYWLVAEASSDSRPVLRRRIGVLVRDSAGIAKTVAWRGWADLP
jgi:hypothetical protein